MTVHRWRDIRNAGGKLSEQRLQEIDADVAGKLCGECNEREASPEHNGLCTVCDARAADRLALATFALEHEGFDADELDELLDR